MSEHRRSEKDEIPDTAMRQSLFLNNLEQWIDEVISRDGVAEKELIKTIMDKFERAMQRTFNTTG